VPIEQQIKRRDEERQVHRIHLGERHERLGVPDGT
jgi:hypothetical protein